MARTSRLRTSRVRSTRPLALASTPSGERVREFSASRAFAWSPTEETSTLEKLNLTQLLVEHREGFAEALCQISRANGVTWTNTRRLRSTRWFAPRARTIRESSVRRPRLARYGEFRFVGQRCPYWSKLMPVLSKLLSAMPSSRYVTRGESPSRHHTRGRSPGMSVHFSRL